MKHKNKSSKIITTEIVGARIRFIRENILKVTQSELAEKVDTSQVLLVRIEKGTGGGIDILYRLVSYFYSKKIAASELFEPADREETVEVYTLKSACNKNIDAAVLAEKIRFIRNEVLNINQNEFAEQVNTAQPLLSRIELAKSSGATEVIFNIINFFYSKGIEAKNLFNPLYDVHLLRPDISQLPVADIIKLHAEAKADLAKALRNMELIEKYLIEVLHSKNN